MAIKDLKKILQQVHEPNEFQLVKHNMNHFKYWIFKLENVKMKDLNSNLRVYRKEHARFDIFINGQYILENDYLTEYNGNSFYVKFKKANFSYNIVGTDEIKIEGDLELL